MVILRPPAHLAVSRLAAGACLSFPGLIHCLSLHITGSSSPGQPVCCFCLQGRLCGASRGDRRIHGVPGFFHLASCFSGSLELPCPSVPRSLSRLDNVSPRAQTTSCLCVRQLTHVGFPSLFGCYVEGCCNHLFTSLFVRTCFGPLDCILKVRIAGSNGNSVFNM